MTNEPTRLCFSPKLVLKSQASELEVGIQVALDA